MTIEEANANQALFRANQFVYQRAIYHLNILAKWADDPIKCIPVSPLSEDNDMEEAWYKTIPGRLSSLNPANFVNMYNGIFKKKAFKTKEARATFLLPPAAMKELETACGLYSDVDLRRWMARLDTDEMKENGKLMSFVRYGRKYIYIQNHCQTIMTFTQTFPEFQKPALIMIDLPWRDADVKVYGPTFSSMTRKKLVEIMHMTMNSTSADGGRTFVFCYSMEQEVDVLYVCREFLKKYATFAGYIWKYDKIDLDRNLLYFLLYFKF